MPLELPEDGLNRWRYGNDACIVGHPERYAHYRCHQDTNEQCPRYLSYQQGGCQQDAEDAEQHSGIVHVTQSDEGGLWRCHYSGTFQSHKSYKQSNTRTDGSPQNQRYGIHDMLAQPCHGKQDKDNAF